MSDNTESPSPSLSDLDKPSRRIGIRRWIGLAVIAVLLVSVGWPAVRNAIESKRRTVCKDHLKHIARALHEYHEAYGSFPPAYTVNKNGEKLHSWRSLILPYLGEAQLYSQIKWDETWDSPRNKALSE